MSETATASTNDDPEVFTDLDGTGADTTEVPAEPTNSELSFPEPDWGLAAADLHTIASDTLIATFHPGRGGALVDLRLRRGNVPLLWRAPWPILPAGTSRPPSSAAVTANENWAGGWRTLFPSSGRAVTMYGADWGYDGEAAVAPYQISDHTETSVRLSTRLLRIPVEMNRTIDIDGDVVRVSESIRNVGRQPVEIMWAQELTLGQPLLAEGATIDCGATIVRPEPDVIRGVSYDDVMPWPRSQSNGGPINLRRPLLPDAGLTRQAYLSDFNEHKATVTNASAGLQVELTWDHERMPFLWLQHEASGQMDFPHFGDSYYLSFSPSTSWPRQGINDARRVSSTALWLTRFEEMTTWVELKINDLREPHPR